MRPRIGRASAMLGFVAATKQTLLKCRTLTIHDDTLLPPSHTGFLHVHIHPPLSALLPTSSSALTQLISTQLTQLISLNSTHSTHLTQLLSHNSSLTFLTQLISNNSSHPTHLTQLTSPNCSLVSLPLLKLWVKGKR